MAYGFNDDKSKAGIIRVSLRANGSFTVPANGEAKVTVSCYRYDGGGVVNVNDIEAFMCLSNYTLGKGSQMFGKTTCGGWYFDADSTNALDHYVIVKNNQSESISVGIAMEVAQGYVMLK